jgi:Methylase involved in ubiquinone/menaquinone biosynthesis
MSASDVTFAGSIPAIYEQYLVPLVFAPYAQDMAARVRGDAPRRILETAAGTGAVTRALAAALPEAEIVATDLNQAMLDRASTTIPAGRVRWQQADAQALPFEDGAFDTLVCQFGAMFFPDKVAAYREALRVLRSGGRFRFSVWDTLAANPASKVVHDAVGAFFPDDPPRFFERAPFGYCDHDRIRDDLRQAGFEAVDIETVEKVTQAPSPREIAIGLCQGTPLRGEIETRAADRLAEVTDRTAAALADHFGPSAFENRMSALVVTARA